MLLIGQKLTQVWRIKSVLRIYSFPLNLLSCVQKALKSIQTKFHWVRMKHNYFIEESNICPTIILNRIIGITNSVKRFQNSIDVTMTWYQNSIRDSNLFLNKACRNLNFMATVYKFNKDVGRNDFSIQFRKIIICYKRIGYNMNVMQQTACLLVNPITVNNFADLYNFNCTPVGRASDFMMAPA